jgi:hypothetical protein
LTATTLPAGQNIDQNFFGAIRGENEVAAPPCVACAPIELTEAAWKSAAQKRRDRQDERKGGAAMTATAPALPALDSPYPLSEEQIAAYQRDGHVLLRGICAPNELAPYRDALTRMTNEYAKNYKPLAERDTYGKAFIQFTNLWQQDPAAARFTLAKRFAKIAADLMGVGGVRLYHDQALYKEPAAATRRGTRTSFTGLWMA